MRDSKKFNALPYEPSLKARAKALRKAGMLHEVILWNALKSGQMNGLDFDRQKIVGSYIVDFFCAEKGVVIEVDGSSHVGREEYDEVRSSYLFSLGLIIIRFSARNVLQNFDGVCETLRHHPALKGSSKKEEDFA